MAWIYTYGDLDDKKKQMNRNHDSMLILEEFKNSVIPNIGTVSQGPKNGTAIGYMLKILHMVDEQWEGVDADAFTEKLQDICTYLSEDTEAFQAAMDAEIEELRRINRAYAHEYQFMMDNLKPFSVIGTTVHYALGDYK